MHRKIAVAVLAVIIAMPGLSDAAPKKPKKKVRTVTFEYTGPCYVNSPAVDGGPNACYTTGSLAVQPAKDELYLTYTAKDASGQKVGMVAFENDNFDTRTHSCGAGKKKFKKAQPFRVVMQVSSACQAVPTSGTITITLSNLP